MFQTFHTASISCIFLGCELSSSEGFSFPLFWWVMRLLSKPFVCLNFLLWLQCDMDVLVWDVGLIVDVVGSIISVVYHF